MIVRKSKRFVSIFDFTNEWSFEIRKREKVKCQRKEI